MAGFNAGFFLIVTLVAVRLYGAFNGIISDCDEVYNYWEPLNFLTRYFGKKTWEYQPEYAIRSWTYLLPYLFLKYPLTWIQKSLEISGAFSEGAIPAYTFFYLVRVALGTSFTFAECQLADALSFIDNDVSNWFLVYEILSPGVFQASISLLPSSFALVLGMFSTAAVIKYFRYDDFSHKVEKDFSLSYTKAQTNNYTETPDTSISDSVEESIDVPAEKATSSTSKGLTSPQIFLCSLYKESLSRRDKYFAISVATASCGGLIGWPFALVLTAPFIFHVVLSITFGKVIPLPLARMNSRKWALLIYFLAGMSCIYLFAWFGSQIDFLFYDKVTFVPLNIALYNVFHASSETGPSIFGVESTGYYFLNLLLNFHAIFLMALVDLIFIFSRSFKMGTSQCLAVYKLPVIIWLAIFCSQPHKEERFMYPVYHLISVAAAIFTSILRTVAVVKNYSAPLSAFKALANQPHTNSDNRLENVCIGREWYHYPSSFFLNSNQRLRYLENGFRGMLPGDFVEPKVKSFAGLRNSTYLEQQGFNNKNQYNPEFASTAIDDCDYYIDINMPVDKSKGEFLIFNSEGLASDGWQTIRCEDMIDPDRSYGLAKLVYIPFKEIQLFNLWWKSLQTSSYVTTIQSNSFFQGMVDRDTYKPVVENEHVKKIFVQTMATVDELDSKFQLSERLPGQVFFHKFCIAKRV
ncbi:hypothetical protein FOA43_000600 [Brettanomyces nanus]|uniref:Mannosyltransferase n=1 Tax=Eeniella nana TaxID=13502 RepID=A0A875RW13_EENNA|nr:uncharacterized protein FOA43_000600 [Brettanomyces nanus]QPG73291.1 hypothetical protein FOA43_000600 [Brettanomyces nanus]